MVTLEITKGALAGQTFDYDEKTRIFIGRQEDCGVVVPENTVGRYHCVLEITPPEVKLQDFGSMNGTFLNGKLIGRRGREQSWEQAKDEPHAVFLLSDGDVVGLSSKCAFKCHIEAAEKCAVCGAALASGKVYEGTVPDGEAYQPIYRDKDGQRICPDCHLKAEKGRIDRLISERKQQEEANRCAAEAARAAAKEAEQKAQEKRLADEKAKREREAEQKRVEAQKAEEARKQAERQRIEAERLAAQMAAQIAAKPKPEPKKCVGCGKPFAPKAADNDLCESCLGDRAKVMDAIIGALLGAADKPEGTPVGPSPVQGYDKVALLGKGGMGEVWKVKERKTGKLFALKTMLPQVAADEKAKRLFLREANVGKCLAHKNVVKTYQTGCANGVFFILMDLCEGGSVDGLMGKKGGKLSLELSTYIILQVLAGLDYVHNMDIDVEIKRGIFGGTKEAHAKGVVHRDFKPGNIFLSDHSDHPIAMVADFGMAKAFNTAGLSNVSKTGTIMGTPVFMPRQQAMQFKYAKPEVDVWAAAASYYNIHTRLIGWLLAGMLLSSAPPAPAQSLSWEKSKNAALAALTQRLRAQSDGLYVYRDFGDTRNHFTQKAKMAGWDADLVVDMDENWSAAPYAGSSCIRCEQSTRSSDWGGWLFLNGMLGKGEATPQLADGSRPGVGLDLTGAHALRFYAKGAQGGETVEFFTAGFGYNGETGKKQVAYPDSAMKQSLGFVRLTSAWQEYAIPLDGVDLSYICCGFGYVLSGDRSGSGTSVFYLDEIRFTGDIALAVKAPVLMRSYDTDNIYIKNAAFSYDNALAAMALVSADRKDQAETILDAFVFAVNNDRHAPGRVRNAYAAGDISAFPGWESGARLPGWYDMGANASGAWCEDRYQVGSNVGNTSYVALALMQYDAIYGSDVYLTTAKTLMDWVIANCSDARDGFTAGYDGWPEGTPPMVYPFTYKSIEHNIDAYAAFHRLYDKTGDLKYRRAANSALAFIQSMYDEEAGVFYAGTLTDGVTPNKDNIVLDAQVWAALALGEAFAPYEKSLLRVEEMKTPGGGYPFCAANKNGGWWAEGTAYTALMHRLRGAYGKAATALNALSSIQFESGLFPAATVEKLSTGFALFTGEDWTYGTDAHIAPAAWFIMAMNGFNPYAFD